MSVVQSLGIHVGCKYLRSTSKKVNNALVSIKCILALCRLLDFWMPTYFASNSTCAIQQCGPREAELSTCPVHVVKCLSLLVSVSVWDLLYGSSQRDGEQCTIYCDCLLAQGCTLLVLDTSVVRFLNDVKKSLPA